MVLILEIVFSTLIGRFFLQKNQKFLNLGKIQNFMKSIFRKKNVFILLNGIFSKIGSWSSYLFIYFKFH